MKCLPSIYPWPWLWCKWSFKLPAFASRKTFLSVMSSWKRSLFTASCFDIDISCAEGKLDSWIVILFICLFFNLDFTFPTACVHYVKERRLQQLLSKTSRTSAKLRLHTFLVGKNYSKCSWVYFSKISLHLNWFMFFSKCHSIADFHRQAWKFQRNSMLSILCLFS